MARHARPLETLAVEGLPEHAVPAFEAAFLTTCATVGYFREEPAETWRVEAVREQGADEMELAGALALAALITGIELPTLLRTDTEAEGWLARTITAFPEQPVGTRFLIRPTHLPNPIDRARIVLRLDAGLAFGSGEHASTQGCLIAFEHVAKRKPRRVLDLGSGSGILALAAAKMLHVKVLASDIEPWSVRICAENARLNGVAHRMRAILADGWKNPRIAGPYDLVFANILARPLCAMARHLAQNLAPGGTAILAGLLGTQARMVLAAHRRCGLRLERRINLGPWTTLVLAKNAWGE